jgi:brefeldin A-inhibited guanine nucleotide-exchange protein
LSAKELNEPVESLTVRNKELSLQLLHSILAKPGPTLRSYAPFITLIKEQLVASLISNILIPIESVCRTAAAIFLDLATHFRRNLKIELGVFLDAVFLKLLSSPTSGFMHKSAALDVIRHLTRDPRMLVSIFVNYDCDSRGGLDIFSQLITSLENLIVKGQSASPTAGGDAALGHPSSWMTFQQQAALRFSAVSTLSIVLRDLRFFAQIPDSTASSSEPSAQLATHFSLQLQSRSKFLRGVALFNDKPDKGLKLLQADGFVGETATEVAQFFQGQISLTKTKMGEFMGDEHSFNKQVMTEYANMMNFAGLEFDGAIRAYLSGFRLPGEAQKIDRMMEAFAARYCSQNPTAFASTDGAYVLAFAVIMLNTDAHSSMV